MEHLGFKDKLILLIIIAVILYPSAYMVTLELWCWAYGLIYD